MADDWRIRECVNQLLLFVAFEVRDAMLGGEGWPIAAPLPLPPFDDVNGKQEFQDLRERVAANPSDVEPVRKFLTLIATLPRRSRDVTLIREQPAWAVGDVVQWWMAAGQGIAAWRAEQMDPRDKGDPQARLSVDGRTPEQWLFEAVSRRLQVEDDEEHPAFWCADHAAAWRLEAIDPTVRPAAWNHPATHHEDCLVALLEWCGDPRREEAGSVDAASGQQLLERWAADYRDRYRGFARASLRLLRRRCRFGRAADAPARRDDWRVHRVAESPRRPRVLRPPVHVCDEADRRPVAAGWVMTPSPAVLVEQLQREAESQPPVAGSIARAIARAAVWATADAGFDLPLPPRGEAEGGGRSDPRADAERLVAIASFVLAVELTPSRDAEKKQIDDPAALDVRERSLWTMAVEGLVPSLERAAGDGRLLPLGAGLGSQPSDRPAVLMLSHDDPPRRCVVGEIGQSARCPETLLGAIEELDWGWWALRTLRDAGLGDAPVATLAALAEESTWESLKRRLLEAGAVDERGSLADAHRGLHVARLRMARAFEGRVDGGVVAWLAESIAAVEAEICCMLASADPAGVARLDPPRTVNGQVDLAAWMESSDDQRPAAAGWEIGWECSMEPFGTPLREALGDDGRLHVAFSAGEQATQADLRFLAAAGVVVGECVPEAEAMLEAVRARLRMAIRDGTAPDIAAAIGDVRSGFGGLHEAAFDRLVARAVERDPAAGAWMRMMASDPRFAFAVHPAVDVGDAGIFVRPAAIDQPLEWQDHDSVPAGGDVEIRFSIDPGRARRILSRGRPPADSAEASVAGLVETVAAGPIDVAEAAAALRLATDRQRTFGDAAPDPVAAAVTVASALASSAAQLGDAAADAFRCLRAWCAASGMTITPHDWHPASGASADGLGVERIDFHDTVPEGRIVVERFGIGAPEGVAVSALEAFLSAGPPPTGYADLRAQAISLADDGEAVGRFRACVLDFPRRFRLDSGEQRRGEAPAAGLFDVVWKAVMKAPERDDLRRAAEAVHHLLDRSFECITFEPKTIGEYPEGWLQTSDGGRPRGLRVERLLRPGLRTIQNKLKWPAIVDTR